MSEAETKQAVGVCTEISEKAGWTAFSIDIGTKYPLRLSTKLDPLIAEARGVGSELATWTYKESEGNINPNTGKPFINKYLEKVEKGGEPGTVPASGTSSSAPPVPHTYEAMHPGDEKRAIARQASLKATAQLMGGALNAGESVEEVMKRFFDVASRMERWVYRDLRGDDLPFE